MAYRATKDVSRLPAIVIGIIERFVEPDLRVKLREGPVDELRLVDDLGVDSLTMMEIVILVEEVVQVQINNEELRNLRTLGDVKTFIDCKVRGVALPAPDRFVGLEQILSVLPMQPPFMFLNEATITRDGALGKYKITGQEFFLQGHFKDNPVMPASMMIEALGQLAVLFLIEGLAPDQGGCADPKEPILFTGADMMRCFRVCRPGDVLLLNLRLKRVRAPLAAFEASIRVGQEKVVVVEDLNLLYKPLLAAASPAAASESPGSPASAPASVSVAASLPAPGLAAAMAQGS